MRKHTFEDTFSGSLSTNDNSKTRNKGEEACKIVSLSAGRASNRNDKKGVNAFFAFEETLGLAMFAHWDIKISPS